MSDYSGFTMGASRLVAQSFSVLMKDIVPFTLIVIIIMLPQTLFDLFTATDNPLEIDKTNLFISMGLGLVLGPMATASLTFGVFQRLRGRDISMGECIGKGLSFLLPVLGVAIVMALAISAGFLLLVVPGIILSCGLFVAPVVAVVEKASVGQALSRSWEITTGYKKTVFCIFILLAVLMYAATWLLNKVGGGGAMATLIGIPFFGFLSALWSTAQVVTYQDLRRTQDDTDIEELAAVFD
jgi:hypothetical protein